MFHYEIYSEDSLIVLKLDGDCDFSELMTGIQTYMNDPKYLPDFTGVLDMRFGKLVLTPGEIRQISEFVHQQKFAKGRWCHIVDDPMNTALGTLYANLIKDEHPLKVFSTIEAASDYVMIDLSKYLKST